MVEPGTADLLAPTLAHHCCAGDEVVEPGTAVLGPGQIRDANRSMLIAAATKAGAKVWGKIGGVLWVK